MTHLPSTGTLVLYESWRTPFVTLAVYAALTAAGILLVRSGGVAAVLGWIVAAFFGACVLLALTGFLRRDSLTLTSRGFAITMASQRLEYRWEQVRGFYTVERTFLGIGRTVVGIDFFPGEAGPFASKATRWADRMTSVPGSSSRAVRGDTGSLQWAYGLEPAELVNLLERWRRANTKPDER